MTTVKPYRTTGIVIGLLFILATITFMAGHTLILGVLDASDGLSRAATEANVLTSGALLLFVDALAVVGIALLIFPLFKHYSEPLALGYIGLRVGELAAILLLMAPAILLAFPAVASTPAELASPAGSDALAMELMLPVATALYRAAMALVFLCVSASGIVLSYVLIRSRLVPRPIAVLGGIGYVAMLLGTVLDMFEVLDLQQGIVALFLAWPVGIFENLALPVWLFVRGFDTRFLAGSRAGHPGSGA